MPRRRGSSRGSSQVAISRRGNTGGIRKTTRSRQAPHRYGQSQEEQASTPVTEDTVTLESESKQAEPTDFINSDPINLQPSSPAYAGNTPVSPSLHSAISSPPHPQDTRMEPNSLEDMRELLRSHEEDIVNQVVRRPRPHNAETHSSPPHNRQAAPELPQEQPRYDPTQARIVQLETELADLRSRREPVGATGGRARELGMYSPLPAPPFSMAIESASGALESVEELFPGVERSTLSQIIENRFKPTNIYRLLASERDRAETQRTISIGGVEFEQAERDGKESEYRMSSFFKAWAAYSGILVKLAPYGLQGELATALFIYTMNLYDLLEKYTWDGVKAYHFQFHRKRVANGKNIYLPSEWRTIDSELIASKCFSHSIPRSNWTSSQSRIPPQSRRISELPLRENPFSPSHAHHPHPYAGPQNTGERRGYHAPNYTPIGSATTSALANAANPGSQVCRNWHYRECRTAHCRHQHSCISCGSNHKATQCNQGSSTTLIPTCGSFPGR